MQRQMQEATSQPIPPLDDTSFPVMVWPDGRPVDPDYVFQRTRGGQEVGPDSIFSVPGADQDGVVHGESVQSMLESLYAAGFRGRATFLSQGPHPRAQEASAVSKAELYPPNECNICTAGVKLMDRQEGYTLLELRHAGMAGCSTCSALYQSVTHYANLLGGEYEAWETKVTQKSIEDSLLLSESDEISVRFYGTSLPLLTLTIEGG